MAENLGLVFQWARVRLSVQLSPQLSADRITRRLGTLSRPTQCNPPCYSDATAVTPPGDNRLFEDLTLSLPGSHSVAVLVPDFTGPYDTPQVSRFGIVVLLEI